MNIKLNALFLSSSLALSIFMKPAMADETNKKIEFQFSAPVQIPGHVLAPGKYVFELMDGPVDRNTVEVFKDSDGRDSLVAILFAIPDYISNTPDKPTIHFKERNSGTPEAIDSWFYPGDNTGWEFVYPQGQNLVADANTRPDSAPVAAAAAPSMPSAPPVQLAQQEDPIPEVVAAEDEQVEEPIVVAQNDAPALQPAPEADFQTSAAQVLPQTGGNSDLELMTGFVMLGGGFAALFASRRKSIA